MDKLTVILRYSVLCCKRLCHSEPWFFPTRIVSDVRRRTHGSACCRRARPCRGGPRPCFPPTLQPEWMLALVCIVLGCVCITATTVLLALSRWNVRVVPYARWMGFSAMLLFCLAAVIFPVGFTMDEIGGGPYQLPSSHQVGLSYIFFVLALWITVISELFAGKVCMPHF
uniref:Putative conserved plasma membrane protein n=1 Tax=Ixodes ricinus TaxID=34613 RepID=A0A090XDN5_IXORI